MLPAVTSIDASDPMEPDGVPLEPLLLIRNDIALGSSMSLSVPPATLRAPVMLKVMEAAPAMCPPGGLPVVTMTFPLVIAAENSSTDKLPAVTFSRAAPPIVPPAKLSIPILKSAAVEMLAAAMLTEALDP